MNASGLKRSFWISGAILFVIGLLGWYDRFVHGHLHANYGNVIIRRITGKEASK